MNCHEQCELEIDIKKVLWWAAACAVSSGIWAVLVFAMITLLK